MRTLTEADSADLAAQLQAHVSSMYTHLAEGGEVMCMSATLPTLFRQASGYHRAMTVTARGVVVTETSDDPQLTAAIRAHAEEINRFVIQDMPAMMADMTRGDPPGHTSHTGTWGAGKKRVTSRKRG